MTTLSVGADGRMEGQGVKRLQSTALGMTDTRVGGTQARSTRFSRLRARHWGSARCC